MMNDECPKRRCLCKWCDDDLMMKLTSYDTWTIWEISLVHSGACYDYLFWKSRGQSCALLQENSNKDPFIWIYASNNIHDSYNMKLELLRWPEAKDIGKGPNQPLKPMMIELYLINQESSTCKQFNENEIRKYHNVLNFFSYCDKRICQNYQTWPIK